jgi:heat shock protein HslJ
MRSKVILHAFAIAAALTSCSHNGDEPPRAGPAIFTASSTTSSEAIPDAHLFETRWVLRSGTKNGKKTDYARDRAPTLMLDEHFSCPGGPRKCTPPTGPAYFFTSGCNSGAGSMVVEGDHITSTGFNSTLVGCAGEVFPFGVGESSASPTTYDITGTVLMLRNPDGLVLKYEADG